ncbi:hypothetical protein IVA95_36940 [Bradyrhizobium sp. 157]|uniref:hypothetical protein n=1 Tax=Bradyrhizobium sp. 157 TaxID=2782631 RepID=UPI001FFB5D56|nr:hypothetical protein [Bradyrhizobium sp. 157]MCK1643001.1 hypothetical protein [Bradyrhizobium sp. 157]
MRKAHSALLALCLALTIAPDIAAAGGTLIVVPGFRGLGYPGGYGYARLYGHPFDDGYDYPFGYGEYAEYGPWAYRRVDACYVLRRVWTARGWRQRAVRICD